MLKYLIPFFSASVSSLIFTPLVRSIAIRLGAIDPPDERKIHSQPIPRLGGFAIFITFYLILLVSSQFNFLQFPLNFLKDINFAWLLVASAIALGLGAIDDFRRISPGIKFLFQIIAGFIVAFASYRIEVISVPFGTFKLGVWSIPITVFWVVAIMNAINLLDGLDGLAGGTSFIACLTIFSISMLNQNIGIALVSVIMAGSILGFLKYNFHPASIFLGDSGAYFLGFIISLLAIMSSQKGTTTVAILISIIALGLPIMETTLSTLRRLLKSLHIVEVDQNKNVVKFFYLEGWSMFKADKEHIHHRLLQLGLTHKKAVVFLYSVSLILGGLAFSSVYFKNINYGLLLTTIAIASYIGIGKLGYSEIRILSNGVLLPLFDIPVVNRRILRVFADMAIISLSYYLAFLLRFEGDFTPVKNYYLYTLPLVLTTKIIIFYFLGLYSGAWRYTNVSDLLKMLKAVVLSCVTSGLLLWIVPGVGIISRAVLIIDFNLLLIFVFGARGSFRILDHLHTSKNHIQKGSVLIYGVGKDGINILKEFIDHPQIGLGPVGFIDDEPKNQGKQVNGYPVLGTLNMLESILETNSISEIVVSRDDIPKEKLDRLSQICSIYSIPLRRFRISFEEIPSNREAI